MTNEQKANITIDALIREGLLFEEGQLIGLTPPGHLRVVQELKRTFFKKLKEDNLRIVGDHDEAFYKFSQLVLEEMDPVSFLVSVYAEHLNA